LARKQKCTRTRSHHTSAALLYDQGRSVRVRATVFATRTRCNTKCFLEKYFHISSSLTNIFTYSKQILIPRGRT
jgi:hypothetical protein